MKNTETLIRNCEFKLKCTMAWDDLRKIPDVEDSFRACDQCKKPVYFVKKEEELSYQIYRNHCVAIHPDLSRKIFQREIIKSASKPLLGHVIMKKNVV
jgi:hypothetical protein